MEKRYILSVDQSTQGTTALLFDENGTLVARAYKSHQQLVDANGWVEHNPEEILQNTLSACREAILSAGIEQHTVIAMGLSNQRETVMAWDKTTGTPLYNAIVWQCARASELCAGLSVFSETVKAKTGLHLSPYFSAAKLAWLLQNIPAVKNAAEQGTLCCGTMDSWLVFRLTKEHAFKTDYSNASRTQLFNIHSLEWDRELCGIFGVPDAALPQVCMSDSLFGTTNLDGFFETAIPICGVLGDSHAALLAQNCREPGDVKATYGTGSSVMMQTGMLPYNSSNGLVTSLAWGLEGTVSYVLEGNINYTGAVIRWLKDIQLIETDAESESLAHRANPEDPCYFVPAFTGLGAPYWDNGATGMFTGITRTTGKAELVKAGLECIGYQIADLLTCMVQCIGIPLTGLRVDGGPTANKYLMQFQSDIANTSLLVSALQDLSGFGAAIAAGTHMGLYNGDTLKQSVRYTGYHPRTDDAWRQVKRSGWKDAVCRALSKDATTIN